MHVDGFFILKPRPPPSSYVLQMYPRQEDLKEYTDAFFANKLFYPFSIVWKTIGLA